MVHGPIIYPSASASIVGSYTTSFHFGPDASRGLEAELAAGAQSVEGTVEMREAVQRPQAEPKSHQRRLVRHATIVQGFAPKERGDAPGGRNGALGDDRSRDWMG